MRAHELRWYGRNLFKERHWSVPKEDNPPLAQIERSGPGGVVRGHKSHPLTFEGARSLAERLVLGRDRMPP
jgi:hypothetical protein